MPGKIFKALKGLFTRRITIDCDQIPHAFNGLPFKKVINWILVEASLFFKPGRPWGWPTHIQIEPANICNIKCALCPVAEGLNRPLGRMEMPLFRKVVDELGEYLLMILLWDWGEPFLNAQVYEMISYAKGRGIKIMSSTNGHIFADKEEADKLVLSGLDSLVFAVDGITQKTYEQYRRGGDLEAVIKGISNVVAAKKEQRSATPFVDFRFIVMGHNEQEIPRLKDFARSLGVDSLTIRTLYPYDDMEHCITKEQSLPFLPTDPDYHHFRHDPNGRDRLRRRRNPCKRLWNNPVVHWDGKVCPCCLDPHNRYVLGDISSESFREIWNKDAYRRTREQFRNDYRKLSLCAECTYAFVGGSDKEYNRATYFFPSSESPYSGESNVG